MTSECSQIARNVRRDIEVTDDKVGGRVSQRGCAYAHQLRRPPLFPPRTPVPLGGFAFSRPGLPTLVKVLTHPDTLFEPVPARSSPLYGGTPVALAAESLLHRHRGNGPKRRHCGVAAEIAHGDTREI